MEEEKGKIVVSWSERETGFQSWGKKRREDDDETLFQRCISKKRRHDPDASRKYNGKDIRNRRDDDNESSIFISNDVLEEIALKLPVKALLRFQTVSKHWRRRIESRSFMERHMLHQKTTHEPPRLVCLTHGERNLTLTTMRWSESCSGTCLVEEVPAHHIERRQPELYSGITQSCDGIVCIFDEDTLTTPVTVMNPAMKRSKILPLSMFQRQCLNKTKPPPDRLILLEPGFGKDHVTGTYKLVWLHNRISDYTLSCEVFDFEANKWSCVMNTPCDLYAFGQPIFTEGWLYWLAGGKQFGDGKVLAYNLHTEMFRVITNRLVSEAPFLGAIGIFSLNDRIWLTDLMGDGGNGIQHFWRIRNALGSHWESEKMFSIDSRLLSPWFVSHDDNESSHPWPCTLVATSEDNNKVIVSNSFHTHLVQLLPRSTSLCVCSAFSAPPHTKFVPYFPSLIFPL
ncbi:unnamed protein product [Thlaspi arvense]|uniref:F-box domain-containing protein n=1 Tax=Thlaspi arvense TaxID=13288 RepID=A0AAU9RMI4_THLAR|nr:unnamed protein product [Thlaspi arvense]